MAGCSCETIHRWRPRSGMPRLGRSARGSLLRRRPRLAGRVHRTATCDTRRRVAASMSAPSPRRGAIVTVYAVAVAIGATLLFLIQPMFARVVLPPLGGAPAVWTTSVLFFQVVLLAAYLYAHALGRHGFTPTRAAIHLLLVAVGALWLPLDIGWTRRWRPVRRRPGGWASPPRRLSACRSLPWPRPRRWSSAGSRRSILREPIRRTRCMRPATRAAWAACSRVSADRRTHLHAEHAEPAMAGRLLRADGQSARGGRSGVPLSAVDGASGGHRERPVAGCAILGTHTELAGASRRGRGAHAERHAVSHDRHCGESTPLGAAALGVSAHVRPGVRAAAEAAHPVWSPRWFRSLASSRPWHCSRR